MPELIDRVLRAFPESFFRALQEQADTAFVKAHSVTASHIAEPERGNMLGQMRHACMEDGFRIAAGEANLVPQALHTTPLGGRYSLVASSGVYLMRGNTQKHCGPPRPTRFRREWATINQWLDPVQGDLWRGFERPPTDRLCVMLVVTSSGRHGDPTVPAFVGIGIPRADLSAWVHLEPLVRLLGRYHDLDTLESASQRTPLVVKDRAIPRLKRRRVISDENE